MSLVVDTAPSVSRCTALVAVPNKITHTLVMTDSSSVHFRGHANLIIECHTDMSNLILEAISKFPPSPQHKSQLFFDNYQDRPLRCSSVIDPSKAIPLYPHPTTLWKEQFLMGDSDFPGGHWIRKARASFRSSEAFRLTGSKLVVLLFPTIRTQDKVNNLSIAFKSRIAVNV
jgi:hypothetical protein